jgi:hypothetical protein
MPISLTIDVPPNTYNPETKAKIKTSDYYPIWNYRYSDGVWEFENEGLLQGPSGNGNYFIEYQASHFSKKNADKKKDEPLDQFNKNTRIWNDRLLLEQQENDKTLEASNNSVVVLETPSNIRLVFKEQSSNFIYWSSGFLNAQGDKVYIPDAPCELPTIIEVWGGCPYYLMGSKIVNDLCTEDPIEIDLTNPTSPGGELINVDFSLTVNCEFARLRPNISAFYDDGCGWKYIGQVVNGHITVPGLETGKGYSFGVWLDDKWYDEFYTIDKTFYTWSIDLPETVCGKY